MGNSINAMENLNERDFGKDLQGDLGGLVLTKEVITLDSGLM